MKYCRRDKIATGCAYSHKTLSNKLLLTAINTLSFSLPRYCKKRFIAPDGSQDQGEPSENRANFPRNVERAQRRSEMRIFLYAINLANVAGHGN